MLSIIFFFIAIIASINQQHFDDGQWIVNKLNSDYNGQATFSTFPFGHIPPSEFARTKTMPYRKPPPVTPEQMLNLDELDLPSLHDLPEAFDWRDHGAVTEVKNQGAVGCCYAMAAVAAIEGQFAIQKQQLQSFSVEHVVDCDPIDCGMFGGWPHNVYQYVIESGGLPTWEEQPCCSCLGTGACFPCTQNKNVTECGPSESYCDRNWTKQQCDPNNWTNAVQISDWKYISNDEDVIAQTLTLVGPFAIAIDATSQFQFYKSGVLDPSKSRLFKCATDVDELNHAVTLVGFGVDNGVKYWTIKNSWGDRWGEDGYFRMVRGIGACGMNDTVSVAIL